MFWQSNSAKLQMPHWFQNLWIPRERKVVGIGGAAPCFAMEVNVVAASFVLCRVDHDARPYCKFKFSEVR